jgi:hypothetical protein
VTESPRRRIDFAFFAVLIEGVLTSLASGAAVRRAAIIQHELYGWKLIRRHVTVTKNTDFLTEEGGAHDSAR